MVKIGCSIQGLVAKVKDMANLASVWGMPAIEVRYTHIT
jgi:hypothetical protein